MPISDKAPEASMTVVAGRILPPCLVLYDGACALCDASVKFCLAKDPRGAINFCAVQSPLGQKLLGAYGLDQNDPSSFVFVEEGRVLLRSDGALSACHYLTFPWPILARLAKILPRFLRDGIYDLIARNRIRIFGARETCLVASPEQKERFLT